MPQPKKWKAAEKEGDISLNGGSRYFLTFKYSLLFIWMEFLNGFSPETDVESRLENFCSDVAKAIFSPDWTL